jgi:hypothetical protein
MEKTGAVNNSFGKDRTQKQADIFWFRGNFRGITSFYKNEFGNAVWMDGGSRQMRYLTDAQPEDSVKVWGRIQIALARTRLVLLRIHNCWNDWLTYVSVVGCGIQYARTQPHCITAYSSKLGWNTLVEFWELEKDKRNRKYHNKSLP